MRDESRSTEVSEVSASWPRRGRPIELDRDRRRSKRTASSSPGRDDSAAVRRSDGEPLDALVVTMQRAVCTATAGRREVAGIGDVTRRDWHRR